MKIPKLFKKAAAFVMAAVTALSIMPATAFAAGDIGTISFSHTYDSNGSLIWISLIVRLLHRKVCHLLS